MRVAVLLIVIEISMTAVLQQLLTGRRPKMIDMIERGECAAYVKNRNALRFSSNFTQMVYETEESDYVGNITIGTPEQQFIVLLDTGSANFWIPGSDCVKRKFLSNSSSTFVKSNITWCSEYITGDVEGVFGTDVVRFGGVNEKQLTVPNTSFGLANVMSSSFEKDPFDGIFGLAFTDLAAGNVTPPLINAINQGLLDLPLFTVWLQKRKSFGQRTKGLITYGAIDETNCGEVIAFESLTSARYYQFKMAAIGVGNYTHQKDYEVISDTGTTFISGPKVVTDRLSEATGAVYNAILDLYMLECNITIPLLYITFGENKYPVDPPNYIVKLTEKLCVPAIHHFRSGGFGPAWIIGIPFVRQYCHIYNIGQKQIGFAPSLIK